MKIREIISEIGHADVIPSLGVKMDAIKKLATIGGNDVWYTDYRFQHMLFFKDGGDIPTYVLISKTADGGFHHVNRLLNSGPKGQLTVLIGIIINNMQMPLVFHHTERLTPDGLSWLVSLIKSGGRGFNVVDQTGSYPDPDVVIKEWEECKQIYQLDDVVKTGPTSIFLS